MIMEINTRLFILDDFWMCFGFCLTTAEMDRLKPANRQPAYFQNMVPLQLGRQYAGSTQFCRTHIYIFSLLRTSGQTIDILRKAGKLCASCYFYAKFLRAPLRLCDTNLF